MVRDERPCRSLHHEGSVFARTSPRERLMVMRAESPSRSHRARRRGDRSAPIDALRSRGPTPSIAAAASRLLFAMRTGETASGFPRGSRSGDGRLSISGRPSAGGRTQGGRLQSCAFRPSPGRGLPRLDRANREVARPFRLGTQPPRRFCRSGLRGAARVGRRHDLALPSRTGPRARRGSGASRGNGGTAARLPDSRLRVNRRAATTGTPSGREDGDRRPEDPFELPLHHHVDVAHRHR